MLILYLFPFLIYSLVLFLITLKSPYQKYYLLGNLIAFFLWMIMICLMAIWLENKSDALLSDITLQNPTDLIKRYEKITFGIIVVCFFILHLCLPIVFKTWMVKKLQSK